MARVLIGFAEAVPAPEVVFSLKAAGHTVSAFARTEAVGLSRLGLEALYAIPAPESDVTDAVTALAAVASSGQPDFILPLDDVGLWLVNEALPGDPRIAGATGELARIALDKSAQIAAAREAGLAVLQTTEVPGGASPTSPTFPAIIKPALAVRSDGERLTKDAAHFLLSEADLSVLPHSDGPRLIQPLIHGVGEGIFGFAGPEGIAAWSGHVRMRMLNPHGSGASACRAVPTDADLKSKVAAFITSLGWRGPFMVEFLRDEAGTPWFMELNGRTWGSLALARRQGFEYPAWAVSQAQSPNFVPTVAPRPAPREMRHLGRDLLHLAFVLKGPKTDFHRERWPSFWRSVAGVLAPAGPRSFYNFDSGARWFFLRDAIATVQAMRRQ